MLFPSPPVHQPPNENERSERSDAADGRTDLALRVAPVQVLTPRVGNLLVLLGGERAGVDLQQVAALRSVPLLHVLVDRLGPETSAVASHTAASMRALKPSAPHRGAVDKSGASPAQSNALKLKSRFNEFLLSMSMGFYTDFCNSTGDVFRKVTCLGFETIIDDVH